MRILIALIILLQIGCSGLASFITGFTGNIASDTINRKMEDVVSSDCKKSDD